MQADRDVAVVGGGLVGSLLAVYLNRRGYRVTVWEQRDDLREAGPEGGRSINLVVTSRGLKALRQVELETLVRKITVPVRGRMMHSVEGELTFQPYGRDESECNYSVSRSELNCLLISEAERRGVRFEFRKRLSDADFGTGRLTFLDETSGETVRTEATVVFGSDGAGSAVRAALRERNVVEESIEPLGHAYKELLIPATADGEYRVERNALHIWPRGEFMLMALANMDGSFTVTLYLPETGPSSVEELDSVERVRELFEREFPDSIPLIPGLDDAFFSNPTGFLGTVRCHPWHFENRVALIGDAAHAIVPFFGQGMNAGFEDCSVLDALIDEHGGDWGSVFAAYTRARKPNADAIADMALENFVEMRDRVGDTGFLLRKQVEHRLERDYPREYRSRYSMVMYGDVPYRVAQEAGLIQRGILDELCDGLGGAAEVDTGLARRLIRDRLTPFLTARSVSLDY